MANKKHEVNETLKDYTSKLSQFSIDDKPLRDKINRAKGLLRENRTDDAARLTSEIGDDLQEAIRSHRMK